jgi:transcriptional regulator with GAF, ATPase, and Fis domain
VPAKLTLYPREGASRHFVLREGVDYSVGREPASDVLIDDPRISAGHARLCSRDSGWLLLDLQSKNGTFVNAIRITEALLESEEWVSLGGFLTRFEIVSEAEVERLRSERVRRLQTFTEARRILDSSLEPRALLSRLLDSVLELIGAERGFLALFSPEGRLCAEVVAGLAAGAVSGDHFSGSYGAIERVLTEDRSIVTSNAKADAFLGRRPSVIEMEIETLACVALRIEGKTTGLIYVDGKKRGGVFTDLDLEILEALSDHAAVAVATFRLDRQIRTLVGAPATEVPLWGRGFFEELERRMEAIARSSGSRSASP